MSAWNMPDTTATPELEAWMARQRTRSLLRFVGKKLDVASKRRRKSILLSIETAQQVLNLVHLQYAAQGESMNKENDNG